MDEVCSSYAWCLSSRRATAKAPSQQPRHVSPRQRRCRNAVFSSPSSSFGAQGWDCCASSQHNCPSASPHTAFHSSVLGTIHAHTRMHLSTAGALFLVFNRPFFRVDFSRSFPSPLLRVHLCRYFSLYFTAPSGRASFGAASTASCAPCCSLFLYIPCRASTLCHTVGCAVCRHTAVVCALKQ
ncbi:hypothetical protein GQ54DRAFT_65587 [Martensiomyces pterosporus]|nr:hypothetical protein GQ54DRAFT_65587 [Martensiomyces pterosporus]